MGDSCENGHMPIEYQYGRDRRAISIDWRPSSVCPIKLLQKSSCVQVAKVLLPLCFSRNYEFEMNEPELALKQQTIAAPYFC